MRRPGSMGTDLKAAWTDGKKVTSLTPALVATLRAAWFPT